MSKAYEGDPFAVVFWTYTAQMQVIYEGTPVDFISTCHARTFAAALMRAADAVESERYRAPVDETVGPLDEYHGQ